MRSRRLVLILVAIAALAAFVLGYRQYLINELKQPVLAKMNDPASAQFRNVKYIGNWGAGENAMICGQVNVRNRMGGFVGFANFASFGTGSVMLDEPGEKDGSVDCSKDTSELPWWWLKF